MGNAFSIVLGIAAIVGAITKILTCYATYAAKLNWWPFQSKSEQEVHLSEADRKLLLEVAVIGVQIKQQLKENQEPTANM